MDKDKFFETLADKFAEYFEATSAKTENGLKHDIFLLIDDFNKDQNGGYLKVEHFREEEIMLKQLQEK